MNGGRQLSPVCKLTNLFFKRWILSMADKAPTLYQLSVDVLPSFYI